MANYKSVQRTNATAEPRVQNAPLDSHGRKRIMVWEYTVPVGGILINDTIELGILPKGARVITGVIHNGALGASSTVSIGITGDTDKYAATIAVAAAGQPQFAHTLALNALSKTTVEELVFATDLGANWAAGIVFHGWLEYVQD